MIKRFLDIILSTIAIIILCPLLIPVIAILKITGEGYIFYKQERVGQNEEPFYLLKFSTMFKDSPSMEGGNITSKNDPRILPFGKLLRKYKINELIPGVTGLAQIKGRDSLSISKKVETEREYLGT